MYNVRDGKCVSVTAIVNYCMCVIGVEEIQKEGRRLRRKGEKEKTRK